MKSAGVVNPYVEGGEPPRSLPTTSNFTTGHWPDAYWRRQWDGTPYVFRASGSRVVMDVRSELGMGASGGRLWTPAVIDAVWNRVTSIAASTPRPSASVESGVRLPLDWLRLALWVTYDAHNPISETQMPRSVLAPMVGEELPASDGHAVTQVALNTADLATDPFRRVYVAPVERVGGGSGTSRKSRIFKIGLVLGVAALVLGGGKSDG